MSVVNSNLYKHLIFFPFQISPANPTEETWNAFPSHTHSAPFYFTSTESLRTVVKYVDQTDGICCSFLNPAAQWFKKATILHYLGSLR